jgi:hypothetical protein
MSDLAMPRRAPELLSTALLLVNYRSQPTFRGVWMSPEDDSHVANFRALMRAITTSVAKETAVAIETTFPARMRVAGGPASVMTATPATIGHYLRTRLFWPLPMDRF